MEREIIGFLCALAALLTLCYAAKPMGGKFTGERALKQVLSVASGDNSDNSKVREGWVGRGGKDPGSIARSVGVELGGGWSIIRIAHISRTCRCVRLVTSI